MRKDNDIEALKRQSSSEFDYQNFSTDKRSSGSKQRWKLLDGVAKLFTWDEEVACKEIR